MDGKEYSVSEAVQISGVPSHVLRYWEEELHLPIRRTSQGHRVYSEKDIELFRKVKKLKDKGIQLRAIRVLLECSQEDALDLGLGEQIREIDSATADDGVPTDGTVVADSGETANHIEAAGDNASADGTVAADSGEAADRDAAADGSGPADQEGGLQFCEIVTVEREPDHLEQFEAILRRLIQEIVEEQNEKLEQVMAERFREEAENLYLQYYQMMREAAAARESGRKHGKLRRLLEMLLGDR